MKDRADEWRFAAKIHGAKFKDEAPSSSHTPSSKSSDSFMFRAPEEYDAMSAEEKQRLTDRMMGQHRQWANKKTSIGI